MDRPWRKPAASTPRPLLPRVAIPLLLLLLIPALLLVSHLHRPYSVPNPDPRPRAACDYSAGKWVRGRRPLHYDATCPFHRSAWNCLRNGREGMGAITSWVWQPDGCGGRVPGIDPGGFLRAMKGRRIGFVGDSLNENFVVAFLCVLWSADGGARKWKRKGAWRGGYFPKFDVTVAYHRAVLLAKYEWQPANESVTTNNIQLEGIHKVNVDVPADDWVNATTFYDVLVFNTGHWWGVDKFPKEKPLTFFKGGKPIVHPLGLMDGLQVVLEHMVQYIEKEVPKTTIKLWRTQSPRHFYGGDWNQNGSCLFKEPLQESQLDSWFHPQNNGVNREARIVNDLISRAVKDTSIQLLNLTHLSEFRADAHPAIWLGKKDAVAIWGQDCLHWCLPGVPDTWVDILSAEILHHLEKD